MELEANDFASALLMPKNEITVALRGKIDMRRLAALKPEWRVSMQALLYRAQSLDLIEKEKATWLWRKFAIDKNANERTSPSLDFPVGDIRQLCARMARLHLDNVRLFTRKIWRKIVTRLRAAICCTSITICTAAPAVQGLRFARGAVELLPPFFAAAFLAIRPLFGRHPGRARLAAHAPQRHGGGILAILCRHVFNLASRDLAIMRRCRSRRRGAFRLSVLLDSCSPMLSGWLRNRRRA